MADVDPNPPPGAHHVLAVPLPQQGRMDAELEAAYETAVNLCRVRFCGLNAPGRSDGVRSLREAIQAHLATCPKGPIDCLDIHAHGSNGVLWLDARQQPPGEQFRIDHTPGARDKLLWLRHLSPRPSFGVRLLGCLTGASCEPGRTDPSGPTTLYLLSRDLGVPVMAPAYGLAVSSWTADGLRLDPAMTTAVRWLPTGTLVREAPQRIRPGPADPRAR